MTDRARVAGPRRVMSLVAGVAAIVATTATESSCENRAESRASSASSSDSPAENSSSGAVIYSVTSNSTITAVTFIGEDGQTRTDSAVGRSWSGDGPRDHGRLLVSATTSRDGAWITCTVKVCDHVVQSASAKGEKGSRVVCDVTY